MTLRTYKTQLHMQRRYQTQFRRIEKILHKLKDKQDTISGELQLLKSNGAKRNQGFFPEFAMLKGSLAYILTICCHDFIDAADTPDGALERNKINGNVITLESDVSAERDRTKPPRQLHIFRNIISKDTFSRRNNTNILHQYKFPNDIYYHHGKINVDELVTVVKGIPESIWQEGAERAARFKVHQYTSTIAFRLGGDDWRTSLHDGITEETFGSHFYLPSEEILNKFGGMAYNKHWSRFMPVVKIFLHFDMIVCLH